MLTSNVRRAALICFVLAVVLSGSVVAQDYWMYPGKLDCLELQVFKPSMKEHSDNYGLLTSTWVLSARIKASDNVAVFVSLPMSNLVIDFAGESYGSSLLGNPYFGIELRPRDAGQVARPVGRIGIRPPMASEDKGSAAFVGWGTLFNSFESVIPNIWTLQLGMGSDFVSRDGVTASINIDAATLIPSEGNGDSEVYGNYNLSVMFNNSGFSGGIGFAGRIWMTEGDMDFGERTVHQLGFEAGYQFGALRPGAHFRLPLDDNLSHYIDNVYGVSLTLAVK